MCKRRTSPLAKPGKRRCLKCDQEFMSEDVTTNRLCAKCNRDNRNVFIPRSASATVYFGGSEPASIHEEL